MYERLLDDEMLDLYRQATAETSLEGEIRILRARLGVAVRKKADDGSPDNKTILAITNMLGRLVRAQAAVAGRDTSALEAILDAAGESVIAEAEGRVAGNRSQVTGNR